MSIRKDKLSGIYQIAISPPGGGARIRCSAGTKDRQAAQEYHDRLKASLWRQAKLGEMPDKIFQDAAVRFLQETAGQRDYATKQRHVAYWRGKFADRTIRSLTSDDIVDGLPTHRVYQKKKPTLLTAATKNRYIATIKHMLYLSMEWGWLDKVPKLPRYQEPDIRVRWEPPAVITRLVGALTLEWMRDAAIVAVATGMREDEILSMQPSQVNLDQHTAWVTHEEAKSKHARSVPLNDDAMAVMKRRLKTAGRYIFTRDGGEDVRVREIDRRAFNRACKVIGITDFRFHDLRHTWASWHVQAGTPLMVVQELGGWRSFKMVQRYAHLAPSHMAAHAHTVNFLAKSESEKKIAA